MTEQKDVTPKSTVTSTGHALSESSYLDSHFVTCQPEYEAMLRSVGIQPGWHVLDAGCGGGSFLPLMAELVGAQGHIDAIDLAPENVAAVEAQIRSGKFPCPVEVRAGNIATLPYPDNAFDAVWSAAVSQYQTDEELRASLAEFRRVVRPGGLVAVKEWDTTGFQLHPAQPTLFWHFLEMIDRSGAAQAGGVFRAITLPQWFRAAGLVNVRRRNTPVERTAPLRAVERSFMASVLKFNAAHAAALALPAEDLELWRAIGDLDSPQHLLNDPDFYWREEHILVIGAVP